MLSFYRNQIIFIMCSPIATNIIDRKIKIIYWILNEKFMFFVLLLVVNHWLLVVLYNFIFGNLYKELEWGGILKSNVFSVNNVNAFR